MYTNYCSCWVSIWGMQFHLRWPQGSVLGPLLFLIYIKWPSSIIPDNISSQIDMFADDCIIYHVGLSSSKSPELLQSDLDSLSSWPDKWQMHFNWSKCYSMHITSNKFPVITTYFLNGQAIERTKAHPILESSFHLTSCLNNHSDYVVKKSLKTLNFISRKRPNWHVSMLQTSSSVTKYLKNR